MKQIIDFSRIWFNTKRALYASMVIILAVSIPALSYVEFSHAKDQPEKTIKVTNTKTAYTSNTMVLQKQS